MSTTNLATQRFTYTGADQIVTVPGGATHVEIKVWGAGGGGAGDTPDFVNAGRGGGGGGFSTGTAAVVPGQRLLVVVGQGGQARSSARTYGQGGAGSRSDYPGGSGGGLSGVFRSSFAQAQALVIAGGGGGGTGTRNPGVGPGGGGGLSGSMAGRNARDGGPGTQTAGGVGGTGGVAPGAAGAVLWGGNAGQNAGKYTMSGGGGGGGYWGGGGGVSQASSNDANQIPGVGGGGSGYVASTVSGGVTTAGQAAPARSTGGIAAGSNNPDYRPGVGNGGGSRTNGGHGQVVLQWQVAVGLLQVVSGDGQTTEPSEQFAVPLVVKACSSDGTTPIPGTVVTFTVTEGEASFPGGGQSVSVTANGNGLATAPALTAGASQGPVKVTAQAGGVQAVFSLNVTPAFEVVPGGPPDVRLVQGGAARYPGVRVRAANGTGPIGPKKVVVRLPAGRGLRWGTEGLPDYQLTVFGGAVYQGQLSADLMTLTFDDVDLDGAPGPEKVLWVAVSAGHDAPLGATSLTFTVGGKSSPSTPIVVTPGVTVSPGGSPVTAARGGAPVYPGVQVRNNGAHGIPPQTVTATLPNAGGMVFGAPGSPDHQLTVMNAAGNATVYVGTLSADGQSLTFSGVDLGIPGDGAESVMWVCVSASPTSPLGPTTVAFSIGGRTSPSTIINVV
ncbi:hypothetical protein ACWCZ5_23355 [Streptomyces sp. NPDC001667]